MQLPFRLLGALVLAGSILLFDHHNTRVWKWAPPLREGQFERGLRPVTLGSDLPAGWTVGAAWVVGAGERAARGWSGLAARDDGLLWALSDQGVGARFAIPEPGDRRLTIQRFELAHRGWPSDAEAIAFDGKRMIIAYEGFARLLVREEGVEQMETLPGFADDNRGAEALFEARDALYVIGEDGARALRFDGGGFERVAITGVSRMPTGAARWPDREDGLLLERGVSLAGFSASVARLEVGDSGLEVSDPQPIGLGFLDNAEGIAITAASGGGYHVWVVTDDNGRAPQRTLLARYDVPPDGWPFG